MSSDNFAEENKHLRKKIVELESKLGQSNQQDHEWPLTLEEYQRYGRQLITPQVGINGQLALKNSKVLVVGAGGLGSPALAYLAGAGVGHIGIVDNDSVDVSNLHRQIIHNTDTVNTPKVISAKKFIEKLNPNVRVVCHEQRLAPQNAFTIAQGYNLILDCTDTPATRYLVNDTAVILSIPLISASALKAEGQISVLNYKSGPCYRCLFPIPPPPDSVLSCGDGGILGPVVGIMGVTQSIEAIKVLCDKYDDFVPFLGIYNAYSFPPWRYMQMRGRKSSCSVCGDNPTISRESIENGSVDYVEFCGRPSAIGLARDYRIVPEAFEKLKIGHNTILDVRESLQYSICSLPGSISKLKLT